MTDSTPPPTSEEVQQAAAFVSERVGMGWAEYHELNCDLFLWRVDPTRFNGQPACDCRGPELFALLVRLADAYMVVVEVAEMLADGDYAVADVCDAIDGPPHWHYIFKEPPCEPMPPAHAAFPAFHPKDTGDERWHERPPIACCPVIAGRAASTGRRAPTASARSATPGLRAAPTRPTRWRPIQPAQALACGPSERRERPAMTFEQYRDTDNCPRSDGGRLRKHDGGRAFAEDPNDPMPSQFHYVCSACGHWWKPIELRRATPGGATDGK